MKIITKKLTMIVVWSKFAIKGILENYIVAKLEDCELNNVIEQCKIYFLTGEEEMGFLGNF